jgi:hypothetical protein
MAMAATAGKAVVYKRAGASHIVIGEEELLRLQRPVRLSSSVAPAAVLDGQQYERVCAPFFFQLHGVLFGGGVRRRRRRRSALLCCCRRGRCGSSTFNFPAPGEVRVARRITKRIPHPPSVRRCRHCLALLEQRSLAHHP